MTHKLLSRSRKSETAGDKKVIKKTAQMFSAEHRPQPNVYTGYDVDVLAEDLRAEAFSLDDSIYLPTVPESTPREKLVAHEAAHYYQNPSPDGILRRYTKYSFDSKVAQTSATTYDKFGNIGRGPGMQKEFIDGARDYLGVDVSSNPANDNVVWLTKGNGVTGAKIVFQSAFSPPVKLPQEIVVADPVTGGSTFERVDDAEIGPDYAGAVFDVAVDIVTGSSNVSIVSNQAMPEGAKTQRTQGISKIEVNPNVIENSKVNVEVARSYDGFWIMLHELFHRANRSNYQTLATEQNKTFLANSNLSASFRERGPMGGEPPDEINWRSDPGSALNPILSFMNVLRAGFGLPVRKSYAKNSSSVIPFEAKSGSKKPGEDFGVHRTSTGQNTSRSTSSPISNSEIDEIQDLITKHYVSNSGLAWMDRMKSAHVELEDPVDFSTHKFSPSSVKVTQSEYEAWLVNASGDRKLYLHAGWGVDYDGEADDGRNSLPMLHIGTIYYSLNGPEGHQSGEGEFLGSNPFYESVGIDEYQQQRRLFGFLSNDPRPGFVSPTKVMGHLWGSFVLGGSDRWKYWSDSDDFLPK